MEFPAIESTIASPPIVTLTVSLYAQLVYCKWLVVGRAVYARLCVDARCVELCARELQSVEEDGGGDNDDTLEEDEPQAVPPEDARCRGERGDERGAAWHAKAEGGARRAVLGHCSVVWRRESAARELELALVDDSIASVPTFRGGE